VDGLAPLSDADREFGELVCAVVRHQVPGEVPVVVAGQWHDRSVLVLAAASQDEVAAKVTVRPLAVLLDEELAGQLSLPWAGGPEV
jgi:hypothetical protein